MKQGWRHLIVCSESPSINNQREIIMGSKDKRKESKGKKPQPKPVPAVMK